MYKLILATLLSFLFQNCFSQYLIEPEVVSWEKLIEIQKSQIKNLEDDYLLSPQCFQDIESYANLDKQTFLQTILWNT